MEHGTGETELQIPGYNGLAIADSNHSCATMRSYCQCNSINIFPVTWFTRASDVANVDDSQTQDTRPAGHISRTDRHPPQAGRTRPSVAWNGITIDAKVKRSIAIPALPARSIIVLSTCMTVICRQTRDVQYSRMT